MGWTNTNSPSILKRHGPTRHPAAYGNGIRLAGSSSAHPAHWCHVAMMPLAGWANQPAPGVLTPAGRGGAGSVVSLPERGRMREAHPAPRHVAPGGGNPELVADHGLLGDVDGVDQRVEAHWRPRRPRGWPVALRPGADGSLL